MQAIMIIDYMTGAGWQAARS